MSDTRPPIEPFEGDFTRILCVVAHPDDIEYGTAAAVHRWVGEGASVSYFLLTRGEAGWTVVFGFGGLQADSLAELAPPRRWPLTLTSVAQALHELETHLLGRIWLGRIRGTKELTDRATLEEEYTLELRTRDRERKLLKKVEKSIRLIDDGSYGWCEETGEPIGVPRLIARPTATLSLEAQERRERVQKLYGD